MQQTKTEVGFKSAIRFALHLIGVVGAELLTHPEIKSWHDLLDYKTALVIILGILAKFGTSSATATSVSVQG